MKGMALERAHVEVTPDGRVSEDGAATYLGYKKSTLTSWRSRDMGPPYFRAGRIWYRIVDLDDWLSKRYVRPGESTF